MNSSTANYSAFTEEPSNTEDNLPQALTPDTLATRARSHEFQTGLREVATTLLAGTLLVLGLIFTTLVIFAVLMFIRSDPFPASGGLVLLANAALIGLGAMALFGLRVQPSPAFNERDRYHLVDQLDLDLMMQDARLHPECLPFMRDIAAQNRLPTYHEREALERYIRSAGTYITLRNWVKMADGLEDIDSILRELDELGTLTDEPGTPRLTPVEVTKGRVLLMPQQQHKF